MNEEELKLLEKIEELPKELNIEIRGLILSEVCLREENQQLKEQINMHLNNEYKLKDRLEKQRKEYQETYKDVRIEIKELKEKLKASEKVRKKGINKIKTLGKFDGEKCTRGLKLWGADFNELLEILDIDKGE